MQRRALSFSYILFFRILLAGFQQAILFHVSSRGCYDVIISNSEPGLKRLMLWQLFRLHAMLSFFVCNAILSFIMQD